MQRIKKDFLKAFRFIAASITGFPLCLIISAKVNANQLDVSVNTAITPAVCTVSLEGGDMVAGTVDFGKIDSSGLSTSGKVSSSKLFNIKFTGCDGDYGVSKPTLTVKGTSAGTASNDLYLFRDTGSTASGLGFVFFVGGQKVTWTGSAEANIQNGKNFQGAPLNGSNWRNTDIPVAVAVSSGNSSTVNGKGIAGTLTATVQFYFTWQ
ncbi:fimbrial protein [Enterobacter cloacae complex sp. ESBL7]|uniref:fimbrial protein n=1 Tax=Enterobacter cloacae complex sp. ESBL7 TaxID=3163325 RepID=UPI0035662D1D